MSDELNESGTDDGSGTENGGFRHFPPQTKSEQEAQNPARLRTIPVGGHQTPSGNGERIKREPERLAEVTKLTDANKEVVRQMRHGNCLDLLDSLADRSVKMLNLDPPFENYDKNEDGSLYVKFTGATHSECDNGGRE